MLKMILENFERLSLNLIPEQVMIKFESSKLGKLIEAIYISFCFGIIAALLFHYSFFVFAFIEEQLFLAFKIPEYDVKYKGYTLIDKQHLSFLPYLIVLSGMIKPKDKDIR